MYRRLFILLCGIACPFFTVNGQAKLEFSQEVKADTAENIRAIASLWEKFYEKQISKQLKGEEFDLHEYWNSEEIANGTADLIGITTGIWNKYDAVKHYTFNIRQLNDDFYEINTMWQYSNGIIPLIYKVCAKKENGEFKLFNYLAFSKDRVMTRETRYINFYYPRSLKPKRRELREAEKFIAQFIDLYDFHDIAQHPKVTYIFANDLDECNLILGLPFTYHRSHYSFAAMMLSPKIIISTIPNHTHELVHTNTTLKYPQMPMLLHEGMANYYGRRGTTRDDFEADNRKFKEYLRRNPDKDLSDFDGLYEYVPDLDFNPFQSLGALLIREALEMGGTEKVKTLFEYQEMDDVFLKEFGIPKSDIRAFLDRIAQK